MPDGHLEYHRTNLRQLVTEGLCSGHWSESTCTLAGEGFDAEKLSEFIG
jgi:hypothetical protein